MSHLLWRYYWDNDVERFRRLLDPASSASYGHPRSSGLAHSAANVAGSPVAVGSSPRAPPGSKQRRTSGYIATPGKAKDSSSSLGKAEVNSRDHAGLTVLLRASLSTDANAHDFAQALLQHPAIDIYIQDPESGWNALHRSLYAGNASIARMLLEKERHDLTSHTSSLVNKVGQLIKTKDHEGHSPFDLYNSTIATRALSRGKSPGDSDSGTDVGDQPDELDDGDDETPDMDQAGITTGDELFVFGSNKNLSLGVGDGDDRQYPERVTLQRPSCLLHRFHRASVGDDEKDERMISGDVDNIPNLIHSRPLIIHDVAMSKFHNAVLTTDPVCNLYVCGVGRGGRLGLGDENTQFRYQPVQGPLADKKIRQVALGQNHTLAIAGDGELWTWGLNSDSQLGYVLPSNLQADEEPMSLSPRQVFGPLKKEVIVGIAASAVHSVAHTGQSLYCWGRNLGQLALVDADSRSLEVQQTPRKVAASLLSAPVAMVSAIDKATTCLLNNGNVWVFTNYGYNLVKFPAPDVYANSALLERFFFSDRLDQSQRKICHVSSGGETIAAVTTRGDLYTMHVRDRDPRQQAGGSTTNPVKIKDAITKPQCIWDSKKDGVASVDVGEHGSVIICTDSGAVWRRVKRLKRKTSTFAGSADAKSKDFKFERVPYITDCVLVRSSIFETFSAVRKDNKIMSREIKIDKQSLWDDVSPLFCLNAFKSPTTSSDHPHKADAKNWIEAIRREGAGSLVHEILRSADIEVDLRQWLQRQALENDDTQLDIRTSDSPDISIPVHTWILSGRSPVIRHALAQLHTSGSAHSSDIFTIERTSDRVIMTLLNVDILTLLNLVVFCYQDAVVPVWRYTRDALSLAYRFRQVRSEVMKVATRLQMPKLEAAARLQAGLEPSLDRDLYKALSDPLFFDDADVLIELEDGEVTAHSHLICQRCPFFEGMFFGRSGGQWLSSRREELASTEMMSVDLQHISFETFQYVLCYIYGDVGPEIFDDVVKPSIDDFSELVLDVMGVANELMLDRLAEICQTVIGKLVTTRNVANLLNEISPCVVTELKDTGLEYICLQLEAMLENHWLDGLDEDLLRELDAVVRDNQLAQFPFARSGRAELVLHEKYPDLLPDIQEERRVRVKEMAFRASQQDDRKMASSFKLRVGSYEETPGANLTPESTRASKKIGLNEPFSPSLRPQRSQGDMIFDMDEDGTSPSGLQSPDLGPTGSHTNLDMDGMPQLPRSWRDAKGKGKSGSPVMADLTSDEVTPSLEAGMEPRSVGSPLAGVPWAASALPTAKLDLRNIMSETSSKSALTASLVDQTFSKEDGRDKSQAKMSQKERKKQQQLQAEARAAAQDEMSNRAPWEKVGASSRPAPWKAASSTSSSQKASLKDTMASESAAKSSMLAGAKPLVASETGQQSVPRRTASPDTRFPGQGRTVSSPVVPSTTPQQHSGGPQQKPESQTKKPVVPHSKSYIKPLAKSEEPSIGASMSDIIGQQRREQELAAEAVAKRSLQEIQQEQAFQEWWDQESKRAQEEETRRQARGRDKGKEGKGTAAAAAAAAARRGRKGGKVGKERVASAAGGENGSGKPVVGGKDAGEKGAGSVRGGRGGRSEGGSREQQQQQQRGGSARGGGAGERGSGGHSSTKGKGAKDSARRV